MLNLLKRNNGAIILLMINALIAFIGVGLVIPVMPTYMDTLGISGTVVGFLVAAFAMTEFLFSPYGGSWSDRYGRKIIIVLGIGLFGFSELLFGLANETIWLFIARLLGGIGAGLIMPAVMAYVIDITTDEDRGLGIGWISAALMTGLIIGPGLGGYLAQFGVRIPFFAAAIAAAVALVLTLIILPESLSKEQQLANRKAKRTNELKALVFSHKTPYFIGLLILLISSLGLGLYETILGLYVDEKFGYTAQDIAAIIMIAAGLAAFVQIFLFNSLINFLGEKKLIIICMLGVAVFMAASIVMQSFWTLVIAVAIVFASIEIIRPTVTTYFSRFAGNDQGLVAGLNASYTSIGFIIGPALAGVLFDININLPFLVGGVIMLLGSTLMILWRAKGQGNAAESNKATPTQSIN